MKPRPGTSAQRAGPLRATLLALLCGFMLTAAFPPGPLPWIAWLSLVPLFYALAGQPPWTAFRLGLIAGLAHYLTLLYWIVFVLHHYGSLELWIGIVPFLLLCLYLALYPALFCCLLTLTSRASFPAIGAAGLWVALEYARARLMTGFPWCLLGYSQYEQGPLVQLSNVTGVYGISFLIVMVNALAFEILLLSRRRMSRSQKWEFVLSAVLVSGALIYGRSCLKGDREARQAVVTRVAIVQANIDQSIKWDPRFQEQTLDIYRSSSLALRAFRPELLVWPETATPFFYQDHRAYAPRVEGLARDMKTVLIFGSPAYRDEGGKISYFNRAYLLNPPRPLLFYDKVHLVPFGEYVPLKKWLPFVHRLVPAAGDFEAGRDVHPLPAGDFMAGILICFEAIFPEIARQHVLKGADVLVNLTNDAWFGRTSAPHQHLAMAVFRAAENARPLIRAANTGISALIDHRGRIMARTPLFKRCTLQGKLDLSLAEQTLYTRWGDWFPYGLIVFSLCRFLSPVIRKKRPRAEGA